VRLFIAVELEDATRQAVSRLVHGVQSALGPAARGVKWVAPENLHVTLKFLGEVPSHRVESAVRAVRRAAPGGAFSLRMGPLVANPSVARPRTLWLDIVEGHEELKALAAGVEAACVADGFLADHRPFRPHVTVGRVREGARLKHLSGALAAAGSSNLPASRVESINMMESRLGRSGPSYEAVEVVRLDPLSRAAVPISVPAER
jgi:2'-5' RNA ligase